MWKLVCSFLKLGFDAATKDFFEDQQSGTFLELQVRLCVVVYLVVVYEVENQVYVSVYGLVLSQLRLHSVQPVNESLESVSKLAGEQQCLLKLVLPAGEHKSLSVNEEVFRSTANRQTSSWLHTATNEGRCILTFLLTCHKRCPTCPSVHSACRPASDYHPEGRSCLSGPVLFERWCHTLSVCCPELFGTPANEKHCQQKVDRPSNKVIFYCI